MSRKLPEMLDKNVPWLFLCVKRGSPNRFLIPILVPSEDEGKVFTPEQAIAITREIFKSFEV